MLASTWQRKHCATSSHIIKHIIKHMHAYSSSFLSSTTVLQLADSAPHSVLSSCAHFCNLCFGFSMQQYMLTHVMMCMHVISLPKVLSYHFLSITAMFLRLYITSVCSLTHRVSSPVGCPSLFPFLAANTLWLMFAAYDAG